MSDLRTRVHDALRETYDVERELGIDGFAVIRCAGVSRQATSGPDNATLR
jgi:hypothetical protein